MSVKTRKIDRYDANYLTTISYNLLQIGLDFLFFFFRPKILR